MLKIVGLLYQPGVSDGAVLNVRRSSLHMNQVADMCKSTCHAVYRVRNAFEEGGLE